MLAANVPSGSGWDLTLIGNSLLVAAAKLSISQFLFPKATAALARIKYNIRGKVELTSELATKVHNTQVQLGLLGVDISLRKMALAGELVTFARSSHCASGTNAGCILAG